MDDLLNPQLVALASPAAAGRAIAIAVPRKWEALHRRDSLCWGRFRGTASYDVAVELEAPRFHCTCPVRTSPCKHALALYLIARRHVDALTDAEVPAEVAKWAAARPLSVTPRAVASEEARQAREELISAGVDDLDRVLRDLTREGIATLPARAYAAVDDAARRLVDAKAPGLAAMLRDVGEAAVGGSRAGEGPWTERVAARLGRLYLLMSAWRNRATLDAETRADVSARVGVPVYQQEVLARPAVRDAWYVLAEQLTEDVDRRTLRTWLWGRTSDRPALLLQFEFPGSSLDRSLRPGTVVEAALCFYPSALPVRALIGSKDATRVMDDAPGESLACLHARYVEALACQPWTESVFGAARDAVVEAADSSDGHGWIVRDATHQVDVSPHFNHVWDLVAVSGGRPLTLFGEWNGRHLMPLGAWSEGRFVELT